MINEERGDLRKMQFGSPHPGLFGTGCEDPRAYCGPPNPRRCATPTGALSLSSVARTSPDRRSASSCSTRRSHHRAFSGAAARVPRDGMLRGCQGGQRSLLNMDTSLPPREGAVLLDSPRSVDACLRLGITPLELLDRSVDAVVESMIQAGEDVSDREVVKMRAAYLARRRKQKHQAALDERNRIILEESRAAPEDPTSKSRAVETSTKIEREERRLQKIVEANKSRLRQQLLHSQLLLKQRQREDERIEAQRRADERRRQLEQREAMEKSRKEEEALALRHEARELERREQAACVELRRAMYEAKDQAVKQRIQMSRMETEAMNEAKRRHNAERRQLMREQADQLLRRRREKFRARWDAFEQSRAEHREEQEMENAVRHTLAEKRQEKIEEAVERSNELLQAKINKTFERERLAQQKLKEHESERQAEAARKHREEEEKEERRKRIYADAQQQEQERVLRLTTGIRSAELRMRDMLEQRGRESRLRQEVMRQRELDKQDCVDRSRRIEEARVEGLERSIDAKNRRIDLMRDQQQRLTRQRKQHRQNAERSRVSIPEVTPGPGDYLVTTGNLGTDAPKWKFGLPAAAMGMRVVSRHHPAPAYESSPGPCRYDALNVNDARHPSTPAFSIARHDRWNDVCAAHITPGPQDYAPEVTVSPQRSRSTSPHRYVPAV